MSVEAIICDIEGTTTDIKFVHNVLFPYAKEKFPTFLAENQNNVTVKNIIDSIKTEYLTNKAELKEVISLIETWILEDKKITQLKELQGLIWVDGYDKGEYKGHLYPEVKDCLKNWINLGVKIFIYSSGSVFAQKLLFSHTEYGDLTPIISGYFDTKIGHKREVQSYQHIAKEIGLDPNSLLFLSDIEEELDAAQSAGFLTGHLNRDGLYETSKHPIYQNFNEVKL